MVDSGKSAKIRVCVIGAGASGLCAVRHLTSDMRNFEPAVFEQQNDIGGTWIYEEKIGLDDSGYPIHSSMYENLRTNLPLKIMNFPDYPKLGENIDAACGNHRDVLNYLHNYADHFKLRQYIEFGTRVESVQPIITENSKRKTIWKVRVKNLRAQLIEEKEYDAVMVCNGHYFKPNVPKISGIETFPGNVIHSHEYRKPDKYAGKRVIILGAGSSGIDIGMELTSQANHVYLSHNRDRLVGPLASNMTQVVGVKRINGSECVLQDGMTIEADSFIYCTGYKYSFPFLDERCEIRVNENYVAPLYKHLINIQHPSMCIVGIPTTVIPFALFHMQVQYYLAYLKGQVTLPAIDEMLEQSKLKSVDKRHAHVFEYRQFDYDNDLAISGGFPRLPAYYKNGYTAWNKARAGNLSNYKNAKFFISSDNINVEIIPQNTPATF